MTSNKAVLNPGWVLVASVSFLFLSSLYGGATLAQLGVNNAASEVSGDSAGTVNSKKTSDQGAGQNANVTRTGTQAALGQFKSSSKDSDIGSSGVVPLAGGTLIRGSSAGDGFGYPYGLWASYQHTRFEDDFTATAFDADGDLFFVGADFSPWDNFVFGAAFGYESTDVDTTFNRGEQEIDGFTIAPYLGAYISDHVGVDFDLTVDFSIGYSNIDIDQFRIDGTGARITSSTGSDRWFFSGNVNASQAYGNFYVSGRAGVLVARDEIGGFTESNGNVVLDQKNELGRLLLGGDVAYTWGNFEPFVSAVYELDFTHENIITATAPQPANDADDVLLGIGLRWYGTQGLTAAFEYNTVLDREDFDSDTFSFQLRADF